MRARQDNSIIMILVGIAVDVNGCIIIVTIAGSWSTTLTRPTITTKPKMRGLKILMGSSNPCCEFFWHPTPLHLKLSTPIHPSTHIHTHTTLMHQTQKHATLVHRTRTHTHTNTQVNTHPLSWHKYLLSSSDAKLWHLTEVEQPLTKAINHEQPNDIRFPLSGLPDSILRRALLQR